MAAIAISSPISAAGAGPMAAPFRPVHRPDLATAVLAIDCEMVSGCQEPAHIPAGEFRYRDIVGRVSVVASNGDCVYDTFVSHQGMEVCDYRTQWSGITAADLLDANGATPFPVMMAQLSALLCGRTVVGHAVHNDWKVLCALKSEQQRLALGIVSADTQKFAEYRALAPGGPWGPGLKMLTEKVLGREIQQGAHSSVVDAQATMELYLRHLEFVDSPAEVAKRHAAILVEEARVEAQRVQALEWAAMEEAAAAALPGWCAAESVCLRQDVVW